MICLEDRQNIAQDVSKAHEAGARLSQACEEAGIDVRTLQRWKARDGLTSGDGRPRAARPMPAHALSAAERARVLELANEPRFADMPPVTFRRIGATAFSASWSHAVSAVMEPLRFRHIGATQGCWRRSKSAVNEMVSPAPRSAVPCEVLSYPVEVIMGDVSLIGIDLGKHVFHLHAQDGSGHMVFRSATRCRGLSCHTRRKEWT